jgi:glucose/arabinose dehydrogenase
MRTARCVTAAFFVAAATPALAQTTARPVCDPGNAGLRLADGFCALLVADQLGSPRHLVVAPNGDIFVAIAGRSGGIVALRDTDGDGRADVRESFGGTQGSGIDLVGGHLYFSPNDAVVRYRLPAGALKPDAAPDTLVTGLPTGGHAAKTIAVASDGALYVNIGSRTNSCQVADRRNESPGNDPCTELDTRAGIWRFDANRTGQTQQRPPSSLAP